MSAKTVEDIALTLIPGIGVKGVVHLLEVFGSAERVFAASEEELAGRAALRRDLAQRIVRREGFAAAEHEAAHCVRHGLCAVASTDGAYPSLLRETPDYPHIIYVKGDPAVLAGPCVSVVGTRDASAYGQKMCARIVHELIERVPGVCIVSGLAFGIDAAAHRAALEAGGATAAVLPCPLPDVVPAQHTALAREILERGGALVTELHSQVKQKGAFYLARNRIIAGLAAGTVVVESPCGGGSLMTAHCADGYGRSVMAVPGRADDPSSRGANLLIRNHKAQLVLSAADVVEELMWDVDLPGAAARAERARPELTAAEASLLASFPASDAVTLDELVVRTGQGAPELSAVLLGLEMAGAVRQLPGNRYLRLL